MLCTKGPASDPSSYSPRERNHLGTQLRQVPSSGRRHDSADVVQTWPGQPAVGQPVGVHAWPQALQAVLVSGSRQLLGRGRLGKDSGGWSLEEFHRQPELNFTEENVHEVTAHLLCDLSDQVPLWTNQDLLRVG